MLKKLALQALASRRPPRENLKRILFPSCNQRHKALPFQVDQQQSLDTEPILNGGYRLEPVPPLLLVSAAASPNGIAATRPRGSHCESRQTQSSHCWSRHLWWVSAGKKQMFLSCQWAIGLAWFAHKNLRRRLWQMIGWLKQARERAGQQFWGWIMRQEQQRFENNYYEMIGMSNMTTFAHRKSRWKLRKLIARLKLVRKGIE